MKLYKVTSTRTETYETFVMAESPDEAEEKADEIVGNDQLSKLCCVTDETVSVEEFGDKDKSKLGKLIPDEYMWKISSSGSTTRTTSPFEADIRYKPLKDLFCPACGRNWLEQHFNGSTIDPTIGLYHIECNYCDFRFNESTDSCDCGENIVEVKTWLAAYELTGKHKGILYEDLNLWFYPEGGKRNAIRREVSEENEKFK